MKNDYKFSVKSKRPEEIYGKVSDYYKGKILSDYAKSKNMMRIQEKITIRALELLDLKSKSSLILDAGAGPGFASMYLKEIGYNVVTLDIISEFLHFYDIKDLNPIAADMCFIPFRPNSFDAIISISALQWIYRELSNKNMEDYLINLAQYVNKILRRDSKAIFQFYPKNDLIMKSIGKIIVENTDIDGTYIIDNPENAKKRRIFLLLVKNH